MNNNSHDLFSTVIKNRDDQEVVNDEYENDYINFNDIVTPNQYIGTKPRETILKHRKIRSHINHFKKFLI